MVSSYGNEVKDRLSDFLTKSRLEAIDYVVSNMQLTVLNVSLWHCKDPWKVPTRRIGDNLILVVQNGSLEVNIAGESQKVNEGEFVLIPENVDHSYTFYNGCRECSIFILHVLPLYPIKGNFFSGFDRFFQELHYPSAIFYQLYLGIAMRNYNQQKAFSLVADCIKQVFIETVMHGHFVVPDKNQDHSRLKDAFMFIHGHYSENIGIRDIADAVGLKEVQFRKIFKHKTGMSPNAYLHRFRLLTSVRMLMRFNRPLKDIATSCGFNSLTYFCTSFKKYFKETPENYKKSQKH